MNTSTRRRFRIGGTPATVFENTFWPLICFTLSGSPFLLLLQVLKLVIPPLFINIVMLLRRVAALPRERFQARHHHPFIFNFHLDVEAISSTWYGVYPSPFFKHTFVTIRYTLSKKNSGLWQDFKHSSTLYSCHSVLRIGDANEERARGRGEGVSFFRQDSCRRHTLPPREIVDVSSLKKEKPFRNLFIINTAMMLWASGWIAYRGKLGFPLETRRLIVAIHYPPPPMDCILTRYLNFSPPSSEKLDLPLLLFLKSRFNTYS